MLLVVLMSLCPSITMTNVAGHLREQNGMYQMILSWKDTDGKVSPIKEVDPCHTFRAFRHKQDSTLVAEQTTIFSVYIFLRVNI